MTVLVACRSSRLMAGASRSAPVCEPLPTGGQNHQSLSLAALDRRLSASAGGASLTLSLEYGTTNSSPDSRTSFSGTRRRIVPNRPDFTSANPSPSSLNTVSISPILYPLESKSSRPSKLSVLRVLNEGPSEDGVRPSERAMAVCEAVSHLRGPGRVPSLSPYPWRSIPNVLTRDVIGTAASAVPWCRHTLET